MQTPAQKGPTEAELNVWQVCSRIRASFYDLDLDAISNLNDEIARLIDEVFHAAVKEASEVCRKEDETGLLRVMHAIEKRKGDRALHALLKKWIMRYCRYCAGCWLRA
ncbi:uncharacterized protein MYCFIDRAFT_196775 [Pseudocercospora fijiensis CIRAD86]|uniref:Uncharacterized protein n=1 Tax=Pseudocercospora fijiensis (strain CIRAD86) TaxID=383855 RepID=M2Z106_PSEFD|nr:uncharacterized protein MYCFIDRAFT_196775 [Pseudocercospora fijiensis CIRAD86]EME83525.1 hypothetical protein MYCFIDRAFT_196775 [Pseudocercospora fijiensis CIRAD86]